jgi:hypothetical protein
VLDEHLDLVGASDAAQSMRDLRKEIPLKDEHIRGGIIDWVDANPNVVRYAETLNDDGFDITPQIWSFMQERQDELPDIEIPDKRTGLLGRLFG